MKNKFNKYTIYSSILNNYIKMISEKYPSDKFSIFLEWISKLNIIIEYMLYTRFLPSKKKLKSTRNITGDLRQLLIKQGKIKETPAEEQPVLLDIIKYFKLLENFILTKIDRRNEVLALKLTKFNAIALECYDTLPKLLFEVRHSDTAIAKLLLTLLFSVIVSYRQFKVTAVFDASTITNEYSGTRTVQDILMNEFSHERVNK